MPEHITPDIFQSIEFLQLMHPEGPWHVVAIEPNRRKGGVTARTFVVGEEDLMADWLTERQGKANCYFHVNRLANSVRNRKAIKGDITEAVFAHIDIDDPTDTTLQKLKSFDPRPSMITFSGGGYQAFWSLTEATSDLKRVENINLTLAQALGGDSCHNIDRIMRLPGTINVPDKKKRNAGRVPTLAFLVDGPESREDLSTYSLDIMPCNVGSGGPLLVSTVPEGISVVGLDILTDAVPTDIRDLIIEGDDLEKPRGSDDARFPSRSEAVWCVACGLARLDIDPLTIAGLLINLELRISESIREKSNPKKAAYRQAIRACEVTKAGWPDEYRNGNPMRSLPNALVALMRLGLAFEFDSFHRRKNISGHAIQEFQGDITDDACTIVRKLVIDQFNFDPGKENVRDAVNTLCVENSHDPVSEYLDALEWDKKPRLDTFLTRYLGAEDTPLNNAIGRIMLIAMVRRARKPGCKFDTMVIFEGQQGSGKSTALRVLAGDDNFSDQDILALDTKGQMEAVEGVWLHEVCELEGLRHSESTKVKSFLSRSEDRGRPAYGRFKEIWPRRCIFVGTTNNDQYLKDTTGNRRFWPVKTAKIDIKALALDRDQLFAEAAYWEEKGASLVLDEELWPAAAIEQQKRMPEDPWFDKLESVSGEVVNGMERISTEELLGGGLDIPFERRKDFHLKAVARIMRQLGWDGPKKIRMKNGKVLRGYEREKMGRQDD